MKRTRYVINKKLLKEEISKAGGFSKFLKKVGVSGPRTAEIVCNDNGECLTVRYIAKRLYQYNPELIVKTRVYWVFWKDVSIIEYDGFVE